LINHHSISVKAPAKSIYTELLSWGESDWWPADVPMLYTRLTEGEPGVGTRYRQKVQKPMGPEWETEIISATEGREVSRKFLKGMFTGVERVYIIPVPGANEVHYMMDFEIVGPVNRLLWESVYRGKHDEGIKKVLRALKHHLEGTETDDAEVDEHPATPEEAARRRFLRGLIRR
jgi:hypothetical protein